MGGGGRGGGGGDVGCGMLEKGEGVEGEQTRPGAQGGNVTLVYGSDTTYNSGVLDFSQAVFLRRKQRRKGGRWFYSAKSLILAGHDRWETRTAFRTISSGALES